MTVRELIETLEEYPGDVPVTAESNEIEQVVIREEIYYSSETGYQDGVVVKLF